jgi:hypothetical protein
MRCHFHRPHFFQHALAVIALAFCHKLAAQTPPQEARVSSVSGPVFLSKSSRPLQALGRGDTLSPGDEIDTRGGGRITIVLTDGSLVVVLPDSRLILKDYRSANTLRELFDILVGSVRIKINHYGGRPNPYRINSPTASIAARGTEFTVNVVAPGDTQVIVYNGLVEVTSLADPSQRVLVEQGQGVIIRPNQDMQLFIPVPGRDAAEGQVGPNEQNGENPRSETPGSGNGGPEDPPRNSVETYQRYISSLVEAGQTPFLMRFEAFGDPHLDSLENPSYATEFNTAEGRVLVLPSFSGTGSVDARSGDSAGVLGSPANHSISTQVSFFTPLRHGRTVVGGSVAGLRSGQTFTLGESSGLVGSTPATDATGLKTNFSSAATTFLTGSLVAARSFGPSGRTSLGIGIDQESGRGSLSSLLTQSDGLGPALQGRTRSQSTIGQTQFKLGFSRELFGNHTLGVYYRYGVQSASDRGQYRTLNNLPQPLDETNTAGHSSEIGFRLRGPLTRRLFYGVQASWVGIRLDDQLLRNASVNSHQRDNVSRAAIGFGIGYTFTPRAVFSLDVAGGFVRSKVLRTEDATGNLLENQSRNNRFLSVDAALQVDVWRHLFVSGSVLATRRSSGSNLILLPDRFGRRLTSDGLLSPGGIASDRTMSYYSEFGLGWRFNSGFLAEYVISTDYGVSAPTSTLLLRYTFRPAEK